MRYTIITVLLLFINADSSFAQIGDTIAYQTIEVNNLKMGIRSDGLLFSNDGEGAFYHQPSGFNLLDDAGLWMGAIDPAGNIKVVINYDHKKGYKDFAPGILSDTGEPLRQHDFNKIWTVTCEDIERHQADYNDNGIIDDPIPAIFGWPGRRNAFFSDYHDYNLPDSDQMLAPYSEDNYNEQYEPNLGEYPEINFAQITSWTYPTPDIIAWFAYNDATIPHRLSGAQPLIFEVHATVFAYHCQEAGLLNNSVFVKHQFINKGIESLDSLFVGAYQDFTLGCPDDYFGTLPDLNTVYAYDAEFAPDMGCEDTNSTLIPPVVAVTNLFPLYNERGEFDTYSIPVASPHTDSLWSEAAGTRFPSTPTEFYNNLAHHWSDNAPLSLNADGYDPLATEDTIYHLFDGRLLDSINWTEAALERPAGHRQALLIDGPIRLNPTQRREHTLVYSVHPAQPTDTSINQVITRMAVDIDSLIYVTNNFITYNTFSYLTQGDCTRETTVSTKNPPLPDATLSLFPNPTSDLFHFSLPQATTASGELIIYDLYGKKVRQQNVPNIRSDHSISIAGFPTGIYWVAINNGVQQWVGKLSVL